MKAFSIFFGRLPLAGKFAIRNFFSGMYRSKSFGERLRYYVGLIAIFALYFWGHGSQVLMGARLVYAQNIPFWAVIAGLLYALINSLAILVHAYLVLRATKFLFSNRYIKSTSHSVNSISYGEVVFSVVVTLAGQFGFLAIYYFFV